MDGTENETQPPDARPENRIVDSSEHRSAKTRRGLYWLGGSLAVVILLPILIYSVVEIRSVVVEHRVVTVIDHAVEAIDMGTPTRKSSPSESCSGGWGGTPALVCEDPDYPGTPAGASATYRIEGMLTSSEAITVVHERLTAAGYQLISGPVCESRRGFVHAVYEDPDGNGIFIRGTFVGNSSEPKEDWRLEITAQVDYGTGRPLPPDGYYSGDPYEPSKCGPGF